MHWEGQAGSPPLQRKGTHDLDLGGECFKLILVQGKAALYFVQLWSSEIWIRTGESELKVINYVYNLVLWPWTSLENHSRSGNPGEDWCVRPCVPVCPLPLIPTPHRLCCDMGHSYALMQCLQRRFQMHHQGFKPGVATCNGKRKGLWFETELTVRSKT